MHSKNKIGNRNFHSKLPIVVFQINPINLIESDEFRETSNVCHGPQTIRLHSRYFEIIDYEVGNVVIIGI